MQRRQPPLPLPHSRAGLAVAHCSQLAPRHDLRLARCAPLALALPLARAARPHQLRRVGFSEACGGVLVTGGAACCAAPASYAAAGAPPARAPTAALLARAPRGRHPECPSPPLAAALAASLLTLLLLAPPL